MKYKYDIIVVGLYFLIITVAAIFLSRKYNKKGSAEEFITGGRSLGWKRTTLALFPMTVDTGMMGLAGLSFVWGFAIQWNAVNFWFTPVFAAIFIIPVYWKSKIVTTPELLEKRFSLPSRVMFSIIMVVFNVVSLTTMLYLGGLIIQMIFGIDVFISALVIAAIVGMYVLMGGMKTMLAINTYQSVFIIISLLIVTVVVLYKIGGLRGLAGIQDVAASGHIIPSTIPPVDWSIFSDKWFPLLGTILWAPLLGTTWLSCNFAMVHRLLAAKRQEDAQKAIVITGMWNTIFCIMAYIIGIGVRQIVLNIEPVPGFVDGSIAPDAAYIHAILNYFPVIVRGVLIAGLMAALISTVDGMIMSSSSLMLNDIYLRLIRPGASGDHQKLVVRIMQVSIAVLVVNLVPIAQSYDTVIALPLHIMGVTFGVIIALFVMGIFSTRATPKAAFTGSIIGMTSSLIMDLVLKFNFTYVGAFSFIITLIAIGTLSMFEKKPDQQKLKNLTVHTLEGMPGPFVGLHSWPGLLKLGIGLFVFWHVAVMMWELYIR